MTDLEDVTRRLDALKSCPAAEFPTHLSQALRQLRFIPAPERRACADAFVRWASESPAGTPLLRAYATFLQAMDRFMREEHEASLELLTRSRAAFAECDDRDGLGLTAMLIGGVYRTFGNYDLALKVCWEALALLQASGQYPVFVAATANSIGNIALDMGHLDDALSMF